MENFVFALNTTIPVFLVMLLGYFLRRIGLLNDAFNKTANAYVFKCALPLSLFQSIYSMDIYSEFNLKFCLFCFVATTVMFGGVWAVSALLLRDKTQVGAFAQAAARSSAAILGLAFAAQIYGNPGMVPMMVMFAVPFFNVYAVVIMSFSPQVAEDGVVPERTGGAAAIRRACIGVVTNPLIIGIALAIPFALLRLQLPVMLTSAMKSVAGTATPIALLVVGASFSGGEAMTRWKPAAAAGFVKLLLLPAIFLPAAAAMGFRGSEMVAILIMTGSPTTVTCYVMAKSMHADSVLTSNAVVISTLFSSVSITFWLYVLRMLAWI